MYSYILTHTVDDGAFFSFICRVRRVYSLRPNVDDAVIDYIFVFQKSCSQLDTFNIVVISIGIFTKGFAKTSFWRHNWFCDGITNCVYISNSYKTRRTSLLLSVEGMKCGRSSDVMKDDMEYRKCFISYRMIRSANFNSELKPFLSHLHVRT